ncbi:hypothetical protein ACH5RR_018377 [Cinchona calisaya]|uniref:Uncharacterized protein n=1 Tax=Cinchona calisaya TaxID=153742 RepID=A0ABD2ZLQ7_9GENT
MEKNPNPITQPHTQKAETLVWKAKPSQQSIKSQGDNSGVSDHEKLAIVTISNNKNSQQAHPLLFEEAPIDPVGKPLALEEISQRLKQHLRQWNRKEFKDIFEGIKDVEKQAQQREQDFEVEQSTQARESLHLAQAHPL